MTEHQCSNSTADASATFFCRALHEGEESEKVARRHKWNAYRSPHPRTLSYRIAEWFIRRQFDAMLDPARATGHNIPVMQAFGALEQCPGMWHNVHVTN